MRSSQELRWHQNIKDNEERRRRYADISKQLDAQQRDHAQKALELRRQERARMDELMRNPAQQPTPPTKPILRKGTGAVLRTQIKTMKNDISTVSLAAEKPNSNGKFVHERQRREWREGLKQYIARQREATRGPTDKEIAAEDVLSWQELKVAAEAGFEELLKNQEAVAAEQQPCGQGHWKRPAMAKQNRGLAGNATGVSSPVPSSQIPASPDDSSDQSKSSPTSKWAARMSKMSEAAMQEKPAASATDCGAVTVQTGGRSKDQHVTDTSRHGDGAAEKAASDCLQPCCDKQHMMITAATCNVEVSSAHLEDKSGRLDACATTAEVMTNHTSTLMCSADSSPDRISCVSKDSQVAADQQHMPAAAQLAADALRYSMERLHRATETVRHSMQSPLTAGLNSTHSRPTSATLLRASVQETRIVQCRCDQQQSKAITPEPMTMPAAEARSAGPAAAESLVYDDLQLPPAKNSSSSIDQESGAELVASIIQCRHSDPAAGVFTAAMSVATSELPPASASPAMLQQGLQQELSSLITGQNEIIYQQQASALSQPVTGPITSIEPHSPVKQSMPCQHHGPPVPLTDQDAATSDEQLCALYTELTALSAADSDNATTPKEQNQQQHFSPSVCDCVEDTQGGVCPDNNNPAVISVAAPPAAIADQGGVQGLTEGPSLDSLLVEVQQLAALRQALKVELAAMGHNDLVAAMGTLRLSTSMQVTPAHTEQAQREPPSPPAQLIRHDDVQLQDATAVQQAQAAIPRGRDVMKMHDELAQAVAGDTVCSQTSTATGVDVQQVDCQHIPATSPTNVEGQQTTSSWPSRTAASASERVQQLIALNPAPQPAADMVYPTGTDPSTRIIQELCTGPAGSETVHAAATQPTMTAMLQPGCNQVSPQSQTDLSLTFSSQTLQQEHAHAAAELEHITAGEAMHAGSLLLQQQQQLSPESQELVVQWEGFKPQLHQAQAGTGPLTRYHPEALLYQPREPPPVPPVVPAVHQSMPTHCATTQHYPVSVAHPVLRSAISSTVTPASAAHWPGNQAAVCSSNYNTNGMCLSSTHQTARLGQCSITSSGGGQRQMGSRPGVLILPVDEGTAVGSVTGTASPVESTASVSSGSTYLSKHARQGKRGSSSGTAADRRSSNDSGGAAERPLVNQGSYLAAALAAKNRAEQEEAKRQLLKATAAAAAEKATAARKLQAQHEGSVKEAKQPVAAVGMGSYVHRLEAHVEQKISERAAERSHSSKPQAVHQQRQQQLQANNKPAVVAAAASHAEQNAHRSCCPAQVTNQSRANLPALHSTKHKRQIDKSCATTTAVVVSSRSSPLASPKPLAGATAVVRSAGSSRAVISNLPSRIPSAPGTPNGTHMAGGLQSPTLGADCSVQATCGSVLRVSCDSDCDYLEREVNDIAENERYTAQQQHQRTAHSVPQDTIGNPCEQPTSSTIAHAAGPQRLSCIYDSSAQSDLCTPDMWAAVQAAAAAATTRKISAAPAASKPMHESDLKACVGVMIAVNSTRMQSADQLCSKRPEQPVNSSAQVPQHSNKKELPKPPGGYSRPRVSQMPPAVAADTSQHNRCIRQSSQQAASQSTRQLDVYKDVEVGVCHGTAATARSTASAQVAKSCTARKRVTNTPIVTRVTVGQPADAAASKQIDLTLDQQKLQASLDALDARLAAIKAHSHSNGRDVPPALQAAAPPVQGTKAIPLASRSAAAGAAKGSRPMSKLPSAVPSKAKEQRDCRPTGARGARGTVAVGAASPELKAASVHQPAVDCDTAIGPWFGQWPATALGCLPPGSPPFPAVPLDCMLASRQDTLINSHALLPHQLGPHAAAAWTAAAPVHLPQPGRLVQAPYNQGGMATADAPPVAGMGMGSYLAGAYYWQQQQYWAALQAQQYQQWQKSSGVSHPASAGSIGMFAGYNRPGAVCIQPPNSAPVSGHFPPGSPLLPTLQYQQTVMRNRTSCNGDGGLPAASCEKEVQGSMQHDSGRAGGVDVWPSRGVESSCMSAGARSSVHHGGHQSSGSIRVYKAGVLS